MCGIAGLLKNGPLDPQVTHGRLLRMTSAIAHRGPDDCGIWTDPDAGIALGHRRLSILDLSREGAQPMSSACGRYVVSFNGEIYNCEEIRQELNHLSVPRWRGYSDTEVMLAAFSRWGLDAAVEKFVGMFAFALWDLKERVLHLVRDRMGEKPLYCGWVDENTFLFGSELKALRAYPEWRGEISRDAIALLLRHNYIPAPYSIYKDVFKVLPGCMISVRAGSAPGRQVRSRRYWSVLKAAESGVSNPVAGSEEEVSRHLEGLLARAVRQQMVADVPLGAFLSGGVDSSLIVSLMQSQSSRAVKTFTIGFTEKSYNEAEHAMAVARHLGTDHTELYITPQEAMDVIPRLPLLYDEPFSDSSQIPTFLVAQLARKRVAVSLSGDAGDELFGGYIRYFLGRDIWKKIGWMPSRVRKGLGRFLTALPPETWGIIFHKLAPVLPRRIRYTAPGDKIHKLAEILAVNSASDFYKKLVSHWDFPRAVVADATEPPTILSSTDGCTALTDFLEQMMYLDMVTYLPDDILVKVDRASMGVGLESRVPFLDHRIVELAWRIPLSMKIRNGQGKWALRKILYKYVPKELIERPKMGFGIPVDEWLRGPLMDWAEHLLGEDRLRAEGFFNPGPIRAKWMEHLSGRRNWQYYLWDILMFQAWYDEYK